MANYYFSSQLPSLDGIGEEAPLPLTQERFWEMCRDHLGEKVLERMKKITLSPPRDEEKTGAGVIDAWNEKEREMRLALGKARAEKMGKTFDCPSLSFSAQTLRLVRSVMEAENPMEAEKALMQARLAALEEVRPMDLFSEDYLLYYALRLKLLHRTRKFDREAGRSSYRSIYDSILNQDSLEAKK